MATTLLHFEAIQRTTQTLFIYTILWLCESDPCEMMFSLESSLPSKSQFPSSLEEVKLSLARFILYPSTPKEVAPQLNAESSLPPLLEPSTTTLHLTSMGLSLGAFSV